MEKPNNEIYGNLNKNTMSEWNIIYKVNNVEHTRATAKRLEYHGKLMEDRYVMVDIESPVAVAFQAGDYIMYRGEKFSIRNIADVEKSARPQSYGGAFEYKDLKLVAQGWQEIEDTQMCDYVYSGNSLHYTGLGSFTFYMTKISDMGYRIKAVLDNKYGEGVWTVNWPSNDALDKLDEPKAISISSGTSIKETLDMLWSNWGITYTVNRWTITMRPSSAGSISVSYGKGNGLKSITRKLNSNVEICTRLRAYGSERNMPYRWYNNKYPSVFGAAMFVPQLMLPHYAYQQNGSFLDEYGELYTSGTEVNLWENPNDIAIESPNSSSFGKRDKEIHWNSEDMGEIFPSLKGMTASEVGITSTTYNDEGRLDVILTNAVYSDGTNIPTSDTGSTETNQLSFKVRIPNPGFNPLSYNTTENVELLVQSGMCQSRGFIVTSATGLNAAGEVATGDSITQYELTCARSIDSEIDQVFPNGLYTILAGDEFVFTGLEFSGDYTTTSWLDVYVSAAEKRLLKAAAKWLSQHDSEDFVYELSIDNIYMKKNTNVAALLTEGAMIQILADDFGTTVYETIDTIVISEGKEDIPTYDITLLKRDETESLGDRVKGLAGQAISASSEISKVNDSVAGKVSKSGFHLLFDPLDANHNIIDINQVTRENLRYIRANVDFYSTGGVTALGSGSGSGGGGSASLNTALDAINNGIGLNNPTGSNKTFVWNGSQWVYGNVGSGGAGGDLPDNISYWEDEETTYEDDGTVVNLSDYALKTWVTNNFLRRDEGITSVDWSIITNKPTTLSGYGISASDSLLSDFVTKSTEQTISGKKTFSHADGITIGSARIYYSSTYGLIVDDGNGGSMNLSATGGVSALGISSGGGASASSLSELLDVNLTNPGNGQALVYDSTTHKWINGTVNTGTSITDVSVASAGLLTGGTITGSTLSLPTRAIDVSDLPDIPASKISGIGSYATQTWVSNNFTNNSGTVTSITLTAGTGITLNSTSAITTSGTRNISISQEYQTKIGHGEAAYNSLPNYALDNSVVHRTGNLNESINGIKTFSNDLVATRIKIGNAYISYDSQNGGLKIDDGNDGEMGIYATGYVSALGIGSSGGSGVSLNEPLNSINNLNGNPTVSNKILYYNGSGWGYTDLPSGSGGASITGVTVAAEGLLTGGGVSGATLTLTTRDIELSDLPTIPTSKISGLGTYALQTWVSNNFTNNAGTVTRVTIKKGTGIAIDTEADITSSGTRTISIDSTWQTKINHGELAYNSLSNYALDNKVVHLAGPETITGDKTFTASLIASNDVYLNKSGQQQWVNFNNGTKNFSFGQEQGGDSVLYASGSVNFYTNINSIPFALFVQGSSGNVGIGKNNPTYKFDVSGYINTTTGYYLDGKLMADSNNGLNIGYGFAAATTPLSTTIWGEGITFRSTDGTNNYTYGGCTKIDDTHGNITYGIMATDFIGVTNKFRFEYDSNYNTVWVLKADGTAVNFASLGGVTSLGVGSSGTPNISSMNIATLTSTTATAATLNVSTIRPISGEIDIYTTDDNYVAFNAQKNGGNDYVTNFSNVGIIGDDGSDETWSIEPDGSATFANENVGVLNVGSSLKVGSSGSSIKRITFNSSTNRLEVVIGGTQDTTYYFQPVS